MVPRNQSITPLTWILVSAVGFLLFLAAALSLIFFGDKIGTIKPQIYFFLLVIMGLVCAAFLSGAMKSHAKYSGKVYGGTLELGGPILVLVLLVFLGFKFMPEKELFTLRFTIYGAANKTQLVNEGSVKLLVSNPLTQRIENGYAAFPDMDTKYKGKKIDILATATGFESLSQPITVPGEDTPVEIFMVKKADSLHIQGMVIDEKGGIIRDAEVMFGNGLVKDTTDRYGNFNVTLPMKEGTEINIRVYDHQALKYNSSHIVGNNSALTLQIK